MTNPAREGDTHRFEVIQIMTGADERLEDGQRTFWKRDGDDYGRVYEVVLLVEVAPRSWCHTLMLPEDAKRFYALRERDEKRRAVPDQPVSGDESVAGDTSTPYDVIEDLSNARDILKKVITDYAQILHQETELPFRISGEEGFSWRKRGASENQPSDDNYRYFAIVGQLVENTWNDAGDDSTERQPDRDATERVMDFLADSLHDSLPDASLGGSLANADIHISFSVPFPEEGS